MRPAKKEDNEVTEELASKGEVCWEKEGAGELEERAGGEGNEEEEVEVEGEREEEGEREGDGEGKEFEFEGGRVSSAHGGVLMFRWENDKSADRNRSRDASR